MGSSVISGTAIGVVAKTGLETRFGALSKRLAAISVESSFDKGIRSFTWLMIKAMVVLVLVIFAINAYLKGAIIQSLLFSLSVAVGLTPEMLPMLVAKSLQGCNRDVQKGSDSETAQRDPELRGDGRAVHRQNGDIDPRQDCSGKTFATWCEKRTMTSCVWHISTVSTRRGLKTFSTGRYVL